MYRALLRPLLFRQDPEQVHVRAIAIANWAGLHAAPFLRTLGAAAVSPILKQQLWGLTFKHPLGLAAGFDKNAAAIPAWYHLGFGFAEVGTLTAHAQPGNPPPRLFRLPADQAVLNRLGFNNDGAAAALPALSQPHPIPIGVNLGKSKIVPLEAATDDYRRSWQTLYGVGDYFVVNVSSPNTPGLRQLQDERFLVDILQTLQAHNPDHKPILVKIAPDLSWDAIDTVIEVLQRCQVAGVIATNTTIQKDHLRTRQLGGKPLTEAAGGISGEPLRSRSTAIIHHIYRQTQGSLPIIGVGGINSAAAAWEKITAGASLLQLYTGLIYQGPGLIREITTGLEAKLAAHHLANITLAIGLDHR